ncbi:hypothetical protein TUMSATVNIG3_47810 [Vibrio nigripulchritudo]|nr:hypothetical protein TUMSATVNIG2_47170 [Vibrio nigripulchritudo]BDU45983.1 hypothetical protein TUMSATVNIG3_47810 [Vibrio nigripulchritudo]
MSLGLSSVLFMATPMNNAELGFKTCDVDPVRTELASLSAHNALSSITNYYVPFAQAHSAVKAGNGYLIDTREYSAETHPQALAIPLFHLRHKLHLKSTPLYLIHNNASRATVESAVTELYLSGFEHVRIIELAPDRQVINFIEADEVTINHQFSNWLVISLDAPLPDGISGQQLDWRNAQQQRTLYAQSRYYLDNQPLGKLIVTAQDTELYQDFYQQFPSDIAQHAWYINGGNQSLQDYADFSYTVRAFQPTLSEDCVWY